MIFCGPCQAFPQELNQLLSPIDNSVVYQLEKIALLIIQQQFRVLLCGFPYNFKNPHSSNY